MKIRCPGCKRNVTGYVRRGDDRCPHCDMKWKFEEEEDRGEMNTTVDEIHPKDRAEGGDSHL